MKISQISFEIVPGFRFAPKNNEPQTSLQVIAGLREFMQRKNLKDVREITGSVQAGK
jgi:hypothetical protein